MIKGLIIREKIVRLFIIISSLILMSCNIGSNHQSPATKEPTVTKYRKITGKVINASDMKPIAGSIVTFNNPLNNKAVGTLTDSEGKFLLDSIPDVVKKLTVVNVSKNKSKEVELNEEDNILIKMD
jgi:hypothetical protein